MWHLRVEQDDAAVFDLVVGDCERAVAEGWSWNDIAASLGVSRQAVHKKHAKRLRALGLHSGRGGV